MDFRILLNRISPALKYIARKHVFSGFYSQEDLYQEMCLYLWQHYGDGLPIGKNVSYVIKACEFHIQNFLRKGRPKAPLVSLEVPVTERGLTLGDILEDRRGSFGMNVTDKLTIDEIKNMGLTGKEKSVLSYLLRGYTVRDAAKELGTSHVMVLKHKKNIIKKWQKKKVTG